jgi:hypothetical protein
MDIHGQTPFNAFVGLDKQLLEFIALRGAAWDRRDFRQITAFFHCVN